MRLWAFAPTQRRDTAVRANPDTQAMASHVKVTNLLILIASAELSVRLSKLSLYLKIFSEILRFKTPRPSVAHYLILFKTCVKKASHVACMVR